MNHIVQETFTHQAETYEVHRWIDGDSIYVRAYKVSDGSPADGYVYSVKTQDQIDAKIMETFIDPFEALVETAKNSVINGTWDSYQQALKELAADGQ